MQSSKVLEYRADLDGLKALAVFAAIFFHAEFEWFRGGFIGVDIFFVISGFLITSIILKDKENNKFSLYIFYLRRIRRVIPALFVVTLFSTLVGSYLMTASDFEPFSKSVVSVLFFISNFFFWTDSGYFGAVSALKPLLHTWSLGVEEQFYIFYPLFLIFFWKFKKNYLILSIILLAILSFILAQIGGNFKYINFSSSYPYFKLPWEWFWQAGSANYYLPFGRIWELMIGALISFYFQKNTIKEKFVNNIYSYFGLLLIIFSIFTYSENLQYPSVFTFAPAMGTGLIILFATKDTHVRKILSTKLLVNLGLIAYGLYLWHLPLFVFAKIYLVSDLNFMISVILIILSMILAYLSWKYIERPFRKRDKITDMNIMTNKKLLSYFASAFLIIFVSASLFNFNKTLKASTELPIKISESMERFEPKDHCFDIEFSHLIDSKKWYCEIGSINKPISFAIIGDSHALALKPVLSTIADEKNLKGIFTGFSACLPFLDIYTIRGDQVEKNCKELNEKLFNFIKANKIAKIFLVSRWSYYTDGTYDESNFSLISENKVFASNKNKSRQAFKYGLKKTIERYNKIKVKVIFIHQVPLQLSAAKNIYLNAIKKDKPNYEKYLYNLSVDYKKHLSLTQFVTSNVNLIKNHSLFEEIHLNKFFCDAQKCIIGTQEGSFYADVGHLSVYGSLKLKNIIEKSFN